jgi:hypothetical protein
MKSLIQSFVKAFLVVAVLMFFALWAYPIVAGPLRLNSHDVITALCSIKIEAILTTAFGAGVTWMLLQIPLVQDVLDFLRSSEIFLKILDRLFQ